MTHKPDGIVESSSADHPVVAPVASRSGYALRRLWMWLAGGAVAGVFIIDLNVSLGVAAGVPYVIAVGFAFFSKEKRAVWVVAATSTLLTVLGFYLSEPGGQLWSVLANRIMALLAIWGATSLCLRNLRLVVALTARMSESQASESRFRSVVDGSPNGVVMIDRTRQIVMVNSELLNSFGYEREELIGQKVEVLVPERYRSSHPGQCDGFFANPQMRSMGEGRELYGRKKDGTEFPIELGLSPIKTSEGLFVLGAVSDISRRKEVEEKLQKAQAEVAEQNKRDRWLAAGQQEIAEVVSGDKSVESLSRNVISTLAKLMDCQVGVFYTVSSSALPADSAYLESDKSNSPQDEIRLRLTGSYAHVVRKHMASEYRLGEGIVGQAAVERSRVVLTDIPEDYIHVESGLGEARPKNLVVQPLVFEDQLKGVIELGSLNSLTQLQLDLLECIRESVSIAINSAEGRARTEELLRQTQEQAQTLRVQQTELQASNNELAERTGELQASEEELKQQSEELQAANEELEEKSQEMQAQQEELREANDSLTARSEDLIAQKNKLQRAKAEIEAKAEEVSQASRYKSEFLANMSHELRTPLNSLLILSQKLADNEEGNLTDHQVESARIIYGGGNDLLNLINDILDLSKVEAGKLNVNLEPVTIQSIVSSIESQFTAVAQQKDLTFETSIAAQAPEQLVTDPQRVEQVLKNLLSNAFKFTAKGSVRMEVTLKETANQPAVAFTVIDTGIGIPTAKQTAIFDAFQQADGSTSRKYGGTGLGLTISRELAKLLGGKVEFESTTGVGSAFTLILPVSNTVSEAIGICQPVASNVSAANVSVAPTVNVGSVVGSEIPTFVPDDRRTTHPGDQSILVIEDDPAFATILANCCRERGFKCLVAGNGATGMQLVSEYCPKAIVLDLGLPDIDGVELLDQLKYNLATRHIPVHILSGADAEADTLHRGAIGYLRKPAAVDAINELLEKLENCLGKDVKKVLLVEDDEGNRTAVSQLLLRKGVEIVAVGTGQEALEQLKLGTFECVVLDLGLPDMCGEELLQQISAASTAHPPVIIYTGKELTGDEHRELREHTDTIVIKGADSPERLLDEVSLFLHSVERDLSTEQRQLLRMLHDPKKILSGRKVLLVDDDMRNLFALSSVLQQAGLVVIKAENGEEALECLAADQEIEVVVMDIMMPVMDGIEATEKIRSNRRWQDLPILALTAKAMPEDRQKCIDAGATDYLSKPVDVERLLTLVKVWMFNNNDCNEEDLECAETSQVDF